MHIKGKVQNNDSSKHYYKVLKVNEEKYTTEYYLGTAVKQYDISEISYIKLTNYFSASKVVLRSRYRSASNFTSY